MLANIYSDLGDQVQAEQNYELELNAARSVHLPAADSTRDELYLGEVQILMGHLRSGLEHVASSRVAASTEGSDAIDTVHAADHRPQSIPQ